MDTSSGRYAVGALLDGRLGCSWDLKISQDHDHTSNNGESMDLGMKLDVQEENPTGVSELPPVQSFVGLSDTVAAPEPRWFADYETETMESAHGMAPYRTESPEHLSSWIANDYQCKTDLQNLLAEIKTVDGPLRIITQPTNLFANIGTSGDNPRSVALCPQRKCLAFSCSTGIELHWTDEATSQGLNRWFPLAAQSDYLYFLPQRHGADSTKKLRLISSSAGPVRSQSLRRKSAPTKWKLRSTHPHHGRLQSMTRLFFGNLPFPNAMNRASLLGDEDESRGILRTVDCDHYRAVPISDGSHILFTDPATGLLCLGSDAPLGGPTKLIRKVCMIPPANNTSSILMSYRAGEEIRWGVRAVAAYDDGRIILYNVPADCFERIRHVKSSTDVWDELEGVMGQSDLLVDVRMTGEQGNGNSDDDENLVVPERQSSIGSSSGFRSLQVDGTVIYQAESEVDDLQIDCSSGGVKVWIFFRARGAVQLSIYAPRNFEVPESHIGVDGLPHTSEIVTEAHMKGIDAPSEDVKHGKRPDIGNREDEVDWTGDQEKHVKFVVYE